MKDLLLFSAIIGLLSAFVPDTPLRREVKIFTTDISNFWLAYENCNGKDAASQEKIFDSIYIQNASPCLKKILTAKKITAKNFVKWIEYEADYFKKCKEVTGKISNYLPGIIADCDKLRLLYPKADIGDVYFMFTGFYTGGQSNNEGIAIGMDFWSLPDTGTVDFKNELNKELVRGIDMMPVTVIHEQVHRNQKINSGNSLLGSCLAEGAADFIAYLITGKVNNPHLYNYGKLNEATLCCRFEKDLATNDFSYWLYNSHSPERPRDLGYFIGFKICESYYNNANDKARAISEIMVIKKPQAFLAKSKYLDCN